MSGTGYGGGGVGYGTIGLGSIGTVGHGSGYGGSGVGYGRGVLVSRRASSPTVILAAAPLVRGSLDRSLIRRIVRRHVNEVKFCYEVEANRTAGLAGRVVVRFVVGSDGAVLSSEIAESELHSPTVEQCIAQAVRRWEFPRTENNNGVVVINYPFVLRLPDDVPAPTPLELEP